MLSYSSLTKTLRYTVRDNYFCIFLKIKKYNSNYIYIVTIYITMD